MIVNGVEPFVGSDRRKAVERVSEELKVPTTATVTLRSLGVGPENVLALRYDVIGAGRKAALNLALVESGLTSDVAHGENAGRSLTHDNVVRGFETVLLAERSSGVVRITAPSALKWKNASVIAFVQDARTSRVHGATAIASLKSR